LFFATFLLGPGDFSHLIDSGIDPNTRIDIAWHESLGVCIFVITFLRLIWVAIRPNAPRHHMTSKIYFLSKLMHIVLWMLLFALPLTALMALGSENHPMTLVGGLRIDKLPWIDNSYLAGIADWGEVHKFLGDSILWLAGVHAFSAIYHHFKLGDKVLNSMLP